MAPLRNPLAVFLFLAVSVGGSWFVIHRGMALKQERARAEATALYIPPWGEAMANTPLPWPFAFEAQPTKLRWRRVVGHAGEKSTLLCFWADFEQEAYAALTGPWGLGEGGRPLGLFIDGFLPPWFLEELCREGFLCPAEERAALLKPTEVFAAPKGRPLLYATPRLNSLFGCLEAG